MKDRIEVRFTVATGKIEAKALKILGKAAEKKLDRVLEAVTKATEHIVQYTIDKYEEEYGHFDKTKEEK